MTALLTSPPHSSLRSTAALPLVLVPPRHLDLTPKFLTTGQLRIGTSADCQISLNLPGIAAEHACLIIGSQRVILKAIDPRTWLNDGAVRSEAVVRAGDRVSLGPVTFVVRRATADDLLAGWPEPADRNATAAAVVEAAPSNPSLDLPVPETVRPDTTPATEPAQEVLTDFDPTLFAIIAGPQATNDVVTGTGCVGNAVSSGTTATVMTTEVLGDLISTLQDVTAARGERERQLTELGALRDQLSAAHATFRDEAVRREQHFAEEAVRLARQSTELATGFAELDQRDQQLCLRAASLQEREDELRVAEADLTVREQSLFAERQRLVEQTESIQRQWQAEVDRQSADWTRWQIQQQQLLANVADQTAALNQQRETLAEQQHHCERVEREQRAERQKLAELREQLHSERAQLQAERQAWQSERDAWLAQRERDESQIQARSAELRQLEREVQVRAEHVQRQQDQLALEVRERARSQAEMQAVEQQLQRDRRLLTEQQSSWHQERDTAWYDINERRKRLDAEADRLQAARHEIERLEQALEAEVAAAALDRRRWQEELQSLSERSSAITVSITNSADFANEDVSSAQWPAANSTEAAVDAIAETSAEIADAAFPASLATEDATDDAPEGLLISAEEVVPEEAEPSAEAIDEDAEETGETESSTAEMDDIQAALDALAERFEEFSVLEHRLAVRHDELLALQQDLAVREAELNAEREALSLERVTWEGERAVWEEDVTAWQAAVEEESTRRIAWEIARQTQQGELNAERRRWAAHLTELATLAATAPVIDARPLTTAVNVDSVPDILPADADDPAAEESIFGSLDVDSEEPDKAARRSRAAVKHELAISDAEHVTTWEHEASAVAGPFADALDRAFVSPVEPDEHPTPQSDVWFGELPSVEHLATAAPTYELATTRSAGTDHELLSEHLTHNFEGSSATGANAALEAAADSSDQPPTAGHDLRSELARMFDLPDNFAERLPEDTAAEVLEPESANDQPVVEEQPDPDDWRSKLSAALATPPAPVEADSEPAVIETFETRQEPAPAPVEDDSIAAYMERLLARSRQRSGREPPSEVETPQTPVTAQPVPTSDASITEASPLSMNEAQPSPRPKIDVEATRAELQSFRQVANQSARSALAVHTLKTTRTELAIQSMLGLASAGGAAYLLTSPLRNGQLMLWPGLGCGIAAIWLSYRVFQSWWSLRRWRLDALPARPYSQILKAESGSELPLDTESPAVLEDSGPATDAVEPEMTTAEHQALTEPRPESLMADSPLISPPPLSASQVSASSAQPELTGSLWDNVWTEPASRSGSNDETATKPVT